MFRFVALLWDSRCAAVSAVAQDLERRLILASQQWLPELQGEGVLVLAADHSTALGAHRLRDGKGIVLGEIFNRQTDIHDDTPARRAVFGARETEEIFASRGRRLISHYWGNYVAVLVSSDGSRRWVLNDPAGSLPCYVTEHRGVQVIFSCLADCLELRCLRFQINWHYVRTQTVNGMFDVESNPFVEISRVHRGECIQFEAGHALVSRSLYWHPARFDGHEDLLEEPELAARALRATVRSCVHSLASSHNSIIQQISGGLDSSIVLGCLSDAPHKPSVTCYTHYVPNSASDERRWARYATARSGYAHIEVASDPGKLMYDQFPALAPSVEPASGFMHWQKGPAERRLSGDVGAGAVLNGEGGDSVFCSTSLVLAIDHSLQRHGFGARTFRTALAVAIRRDRTVWSVLAKAMGRRFFGTRMREVRALLSPTLQLVSEQARQSVTPQDHFPNPWFCADEHVPLETIWRLGPLAFVPMFYDLSTSSQSAAPYALSPLCSQPVYELTRRIPVDVHFDGGRSRGLARRAFTHEVPAQILRRQWKDRPLLQVRQVVQQNLAFIRETLLDGALTKEGILDRAAVELALRGDPTKSRAMSGEILTHLDLELWIRQNA